MRIVLKQVYVGEEEREQQLRHMQAPAEGVCVYRRIRPGIAACLQLCTNERITYADAYQDGCTCASILLYKYQNQGFYE